MLQAIFWWVGLFVCVALARKFTVAVIARHKEFCYWTTTVFESLAPLTRSTASPQVSLPWIVINIPRRTHLVDHIARKIASRWPLHPVLLLTTAGDDTSELKQLLTTDENRRNNARVSEIVLFDPYGPVSVLEDAVKDKVVGLLLSCLETSLETKAAEHWAAEEIKNEVWSTMRGHMMLTRLVLPNMIKRQAGAVVAFCSELPELGIPARSIQSAVAHGLMIFARALQTECRSKNILVQTWLYHRFGEARHLPFIENYLSESNSAELCSERCLNCLETGSTSWIFPLGYTPSVFRPCLRQEFLAMAACCVPSHVLAALRHSPVSIF